MTNTQRTVSALKAIPKEKLADKIRKTVAGVFLAGLGIVATWQFEAPWWVAVGSGLLGATVWSGELVVAPVDAELTAYTTVRAGLDRAVA